MGVKKTPIIIAIILIIAVIAGGVIFFQSGTAAVDKNDKTEIIVPIESGSGAYDIMYALGDAGLIKNITCAKFYVKFFAPDTLQANTYVLNKTLSVQEMMDIIATGDFHYIQKNRFTIIEGATSKDAAAAISEAFDFTTDEILDKWSDEAYLQTLIDTYWFLTDEILADGILCPLEGYLYPETYFVVDQEPTIEGVTKQILDIADEQITPLKDQISAMDMSVHEFLTFTSVVENESLFEADRPKIAGVFINRLNENMALQSDITVLYALGEKRVDVTYADLEVDSPYNTYMYAGLPIGPVSNPSKATMEDCTNYEKHDFFYFFATEDGKVLYTKTLAEHEQVVEENLWY